MRRGLMPALGRCMGFSPQDWGPSDGGQCEPGDASPGSEWSPRDSGTHCSVGAGCFDEGKSRSLPDG